MFDYEKWLSLSHEEWMEHYRANRRRKKRYSGPKGEPIPGTGTGRRFRTRKLHGRKMQPYERPRKGGGRHRMECD